mmetsp:Transcript_9982/g.25277  ORF Transcript_9982/g.25277 Transcript_9982/m.25277 type:complete len:111 (+) Transcript_9982:80-412(+)
MLISYTTTCASRQEAATQTRTTVLWDGSRGGFGVREESWMDGWMAFGFREKSLIRCNVKPQVVPSVVGANNGAKPEVLVGCLGQRQDELQHLLDEHFGRALRLHDDRAAP